MILMDLRQAAAELHCSERWLADNLRARRFPAKKIGRKWMLGDDDIAAIVQICSVAPAAFSTDAAIGAAPSSSMTKTTLRRLQQSSHPDNHHHKIHRSRGARRNENPGRQRKEQAKCP
jgi:hypothetical protein